MMKVKDDNLGLKNETKVSEDQKKEEEVKQEK
jgi:hypothetical protein